MALVMVVMVLQAPTERASAYSVFQFYFEFYCVSFRLILPIYSFLSYSNRRNEEYKRNAKSLLLNLNLNLIFLKPFASVPAQCWYQIRIVYCQRSLRVLFLCVFVCAWFFDVMPTLFSIRCVCSFHLHDGFCRRFSAISLSHFRNAY